MGIPYVSFEIFKNMSIVWRRTRDEILKIKMKRFRVITSFYGVLFLVLGVWGELVFSFETPIKFITTIVLALTGLFLIVMGNGRKSVSWPKAQAWEIYFAIIAVMIIVSLLKLLPIIAALFLGLKVCVFVFVIHAFCLLAILLREKYAEGHRY